MPTFKVFSRRPTCVNLTPGSSESNNQPAFAKASPRSSQDIGQSLGIELEIPAADRRSQLSQRSEEGRGENHDEAIAANEAERPPMEANQEGGSEALGNEGHEPGVTANVVEAPLLGASRESGKEANATMGDENHDQAVTASEGEDPLNEASQEGGEQAVNSDVGGDPSRERSHNGDGQPNTESHSMAEDASRPPEAEGISNDTSSIEELSDNTCS